MTTRNYHLNVRLSASEYETLKFMASQSKKSLSTVAREKLFSSVGLANVSAKTLREREQQKQLQTLINLVSDLMSLDELEWHKTLNKIRPLLEHIQQLEDETYDWQGDSKR